MYGRSSGCRVAGTRPSEAQGEAQGQVYIIHLSASNWGAGGVIAGIGVRSLLFTFHGW